MPSKSNSKSKSQKKRLLEKAHKTYKKKVYPTLLTTFFNPLNTIPENNKENNNDVKNENNKENKNEQNNEVKVKVSQYNITRDLDNQFQDKYIENLARIKIALKGSGRHQINKEKATEFINRQLSPIRRQAAKDLLDNTHYISLRETFQIIETLLLSLYEKIDTTKTIYLYCGDNNKSFYFFACIALYYIKKHKLKMPEFVTDITPEFLLEVQDCPIIIVDDVSYSGSQLSNMLNNIYYHICVEELLPPPNIYVLLTALNDVSLKRLNSVPITRIVTGDYIKFIDSPFHIEYLEEKLFNSLVRVLGIERYFYINLFFNAFLSNETNIALYLDHKVADSTSTYKNVYLYGPIVPHDYDVLELIEIVFIEPVYSYQFFTKEINETLFANFLNDNPAFVSQSNEYISIYKEVVTFLIRKAKQLDIIDKPYTEHLEFVPFIEGCRKSHALKKIITDPDVLASQYLFFMFDNGLSFSNLREYEDIMIHPIKETRRIIKLLDSYRCPENWYKKGILKLI